MSSSEVVVYTRPGCPYCFMLRRGLRRRKLPFTEINIWESTEAAAAVRAVADGNETVPTVHVAGKWLVNPKAAEVVDLARR
jgi:glutaredoxin-like protein